MTTPKQQPKFDLRQLYNSYVVNNTASNEQKTISVVEYGMLLEIINQQEETMQGETGEDLVAEFSGFVQSPFHVSWYAMPINEFKLESAIAQAINEKNDIVITQILPVRDLLDK